MRMDKLTDPGVVWTPEAGVARLRELWEQAADYSLQHELVANMLRQGSDKLLEVLYAERSRLQELHAKEKDGDEQLRLRALHERAQGIIAFVWRRIAFQNSTGLL